MPANVPFDDELPVMTRRGRPRALVTPLSRLCQQYDIRIKDLVSKFPGTKQRLWVDLLAGRTDINIMLSTQQKEGLCRMFDTTPLFLSNYTIDTVRRVERKTKIVIQEIELEEFPDLDELDADSWD